MHLFELCKRGFLGRYLFLEASAPCDKTRGGTVMNRRLIRPKFVGQTVEFAKAPLLDKLHRTDSFMHLRLRHVQRLLLPPSLRRVLALACLYALQIVLYLRQLLLGSIDLALKQVDRLLVLRLGFSQLSHLLLAAPQVVLRCAQLLLGSLKLALKLGNHVLVLELGGKIC
jgi:hypothetical protein